MLPGLTDGEVAPPDEELWRLVKGRRTAVCWRRLNPHGFELRFDVNGDTRRTTVERTVEAAQEQSVHMREAKLPGRWAE